MEGEERSPVEWVPIEDDGDLSPGNQSPALQIPMAPGLLGGRGVSDTGDVLPRNRSECGLQHAQRASSKPDPEVLHYGDELRLWACSEYALNALSSGHNPSSPSPLHDRESSISSTRGEQRLASGLQKDSFMKASLHASVPLDEPRQTGGYVGIYFKGKKRKARTGQQPLACVPPIGRQANGELYESIFRCVDPHGVKTDSDPVRLGDELLLVDSEGHVWNTSTAGVIGYLTVRLRGERGELRVRFSRDLSSVNYKGVCYADQSPPGGVCNDDTWSDFNSRPDTPPMALSSKYHQANTSTDHLDIAHRQSSPRGLTRPRSSTKMRTSPRSSFTEQPCIRYGDALWLVSCPQHDETHPGAARNMRKEHVLTNFKRETSSTLGGYLTVDPRGFALQFLVARAPPAVDVLQIADQSHYGLPWDTPIAFSSSPGKCSIRVLFSTGATCELPDLNEKLFLSRYHNESQHSPPAAILSTGRQHIERHHSGVHTAKFWLKLTSTSCQTSMGSVLVEVAAIQSAGPASTTSSPNTSEKNTFDQLIVTHDPVSQLAARLAVAASALVALESAAARAVVAAAAAADSSLVWGHMMLVSATKDTTTPPVASVLTAALALLAAAAPAFVGWLACALVWIAAILMTIKPPPKVLKDEIIKKKRCKGVEISPLTTISTRLPGLRGEVSLVEWSPDSGLGGRQTSETRLSPPATSDAQRTVSFDKRIQSDEIGRESSIDRSSLVAASTAPASMAYPAKGRREGGKTENVDTMEKGCIAELREAVKKETFAPRWLEDGELLRFVRARKSIEERVELYREAMLWRKHHSAEAPQGVYGQSARLKPQLGSFGCLEQDWCIKRQQPPAWWAFLSSNVPFELYGSDRTGLPITYLGLGRMDLAGVTREVGIDRLEQKIVMQNDMFLDLARQRRLDTGESSWNYDIPSSQVQDFRALHGGIFIIDCDGMARRHLTEIRIFKRVSAALKVLHPERQRKTFIVRAPRVFAVIWRLIKPMLDARIISKVNILGPNDSLKPLIDELGQDNVPSILGGNFQLANPPNNSLIAQGAYDIFKKTYEPGPPLSTPTPSEAAPAKPSVATSSSSLDSISSRH